MDGSVMDAEADGSAMDAEAGVVAHDVALETPEDTPLEVSLLAEGEGTLTFEIIAAPEHGTASELSAEGVVTYTPDADYHGADALVFRVTDAGGGSAEATVTITITPVNDAPTLSAIADQTIDEGGATDALAFTVGDVETTADELVVTATSSDTMLVPNDPASFVFGGAGADRTLSVVPAAGESGSTTITLSVSDGVGTTSTTFTLVVVARPARLYFMTAAGSLWRVDVDGEHAVELETGISSASNVAVDPVTRSVFYSRGSAIVRTDEDGENGVDIVANGGLPSGLAVDATNERLYWSDFNGSRVMRAGLDGSNPMEVASAVNSPSGIAIDVPNGKVYVITYNNTRLVRFDLGGGNFETLAMSLGGQGLGLAVDSSGGKVYFSTRGNSIYVAGLDGSNVTALVTGQNTVHGIAIDLSSGRLYFTDWLGQLVRRAALADGGDVVTVNSGSSRNLGLAFMPAP